MIDEHSPSRRRRCQPFASVLVAKYGERAASVTGVPNVYAYASRASVRETDGDYERLKAALDNMLKNSNRRRS